MKDIRGIQIVRIPLKKIGSDFKKKLSECLIHPR